MELILEVAKSNKLQPHEIPDLIVFSDMQFDQARSYRNPWETHHERIVRRFEETGILVCGRKWPAPQIIYWNLRGDTVGFPAQANTPGVKMLSGFSPSLMKLLLDGDDLEEENGAMEVENKDENSKKNPYHMVRKALDDEAYDSIRKILKDSREGALAEFTMLPN